MTDYMYSFSLALQTRLFLMSLGFGFIVGLVYDIFRAFRILSGSKKWAYRLTDIVFLITLGFLNFLFFLVGNEGEIRFFALLGEAFGFTVYFFSIGPAAVALFEKAWCVLRRFLTTVFKIITFPIKKAASFLCGLVKKHLKKPKKSKNKSKYPLKVNCRLLYNLTNRKKNSAIVNEGSYDDEQKFRS